MEESDKKLRCVSEGFPFSVKIDRGYFWTRSRDSLLARPADGELVHYPVAYQNDHFGRTDKLYPDPACVLDNRRYRGCVTGRKGMPVQVGASYYHKGDPLLLIDRLLVSVMPFNTGFYDICQMTTGEDGREFDKRVLRVFSLLKSSVVVPVEAYSECSHRVKIILGPFQKEFKRYVAAYCAKKDVTDEQGRAHFKGSKFVYTMTESAGVTRSCLLVDTVPAIVIWRKTAAVAYATRAAINRFPALRERLEK